jgi:hypothetical protein
MLTKIPKTLCHKGCNSIEDLGHQDYVCHFQKSSSNPHSPLVVSLDSPCPYDQGICPERPIYECVSDSSNYHWGNRHRGAKVTPAIPDTRLKLRESTLLKSVEATLGYIYDGNGPTESPLAPSSPSCTPRRCDSLVIEERVVLTFPSSPSCTALDTKAGLLTQDLRQDPVRVHPEIKPPKNPTTANIFDPKYH